MPDHEASPGSPSRGGSGYSQELSDVEGLTRPSVPTGIDQAWHLYVVTHPERDRLQQHLSRHGVATLIHYPIPPHRQIAYGGAHVRESLPIADGLASQVLRLPIGPHLDASAVEAVIAAVTNFS